MSERKQFKSTHSASRYRDTTNQQPLDAVMDDVEADKSGFKHSADFLGMQPAAWSQMPRGLDEVGQVYQTNLESTYPGQVAITPLFSQPPTTQATNSSMARSTYFPASTLGPRSRLISAYNSNPQYNNQFAPPMQLVSQTHGSGQIPLNPSTSRHFPYQMDPPAQPTSASESTPAAGRCTPCRGHPAPGWCWKCKWHYSSCAQIGHNDDRYCFHCMRTRLWDGVERRD